MNGWMDRRHMPSDSKRSHGFRNSCITLTLQLHLDRSSSPAFGFLCPFLSPLIKQFEFSQNFPCLKL